MSKIIKMFSRDEYVVSEEEATRVEGVINSSVTKVVRLRSGDVINVSGIEAIKKIPLVAYYVVDGEKYRVLRDGETIVNDYGNRVKINPDRVQFLEDERYEKMALASGTEQKRLT